MMYYSKYRNPKNATFHLFSLLIVISELKEPNETCLKTTVLSTMSACTCLLLCILTASLLITCSKLRHRKKDAGIYDAYINHKGQID